MSVNQAARQPSLLLREKGEGCLGADGSEEPAKLSLTPAQGLQQPGALQPLASCPKLVVLNLQGNPLCQIVGTLEHLAELLPSVSILT